MDSKKIYEAPSSSVVELNLKASILQASKPDYIPAPW